MKTKSFRQTVLFKGAEPKQIYQMIMSSKLHSEFTGETAKMSTREGGKFSAYSGYCEGRNVKLVPNRKIVQTWRSADWPEDAMSEVTFELKKSPTGTRLTFSQKGVPPHDFAAIKKGWVDYYWTPMKEFLRR